MLQVELAGALGMLLPQKALLWDGSLFVADLHLGKDGDFRRRGVPVPCGPSQTTLNLLSEAIEATAPARLIILGDLWHSQSSFDNHLLDLLGAWRAHHAGLDVVLVRGNHDRGAVDFGQQFAIAEAPEGEVLNGLALCHHPPEKAEFPWVAGHFHPSFGIRSGRAAGAHPCFWKRGEGLVLPAFGEFTGGKAIDPQPGDKVWIPIADRVIPMALP